MDDNVDNTRGIYKFQAPSSTLIVGGSQSGKTVLVSKILRVADEMYTIPPSKILYCYGIYQKIFSQLESEVEKLSLHEGLPTMETIEDIGSQDDDTHNLLVLDDMMDEIYKSPEFCSLFTRGVHHRRISVIMLSQNLFHQSKYSRTINLNSNYLILMKTYRDLQQIHFLSRQMFPNTPKRLLEAYEDATSRPRSYLVVNNLVNTEDQDTRLACDILPDETLVLYTRK